MKFRKSDGKTKPCGHFHIVILLHGLWGRFHNYSSNNGYHGRKERKWKNENLKIKRKKGIIMSTYHRDHAGNLCNNSNNNGNLGRKLEKWRGRKRKEKKKKKKRRKKKEKKIYSVSTFTSIYVFDISSLFSFFWFLSMKVKLCDFNWIQV